MFNRLPLDFVSDKVKDIPTDFAYSNKTVTITDKEAGPDFVWIFQDLAIYLDIISSI